ncbi:hypothetical protein Tco_0448689 [Tanacetum coccineum]
MSLEESDNLNIQDVDPIDPVLEADVLPKFNMHLYQSSVTKTHVKWLVKCYKIPEDLHPRVVPEGMTMDAIPYDSIGLYLKEMKDRRATTIAMPWRHHDSSVADPFPKSGKFSESKAERLHEFVITLHKPAPILTLAEFLRMPNFKGCKVVAGTLLPSGTACLTHTTPPATRLEDIQPKTGDMEVAKIPCRKQSSDRHNVNKEMSDHLVGVGGGNGDGDGGFVNEGHGDNTGGLSGLHTQPSPSNHLERDAVETAACYTAGRFGDLPFAPQWGLTDSSLMDNSHNCRDMLANLFMPADNEFLNDDVSDQSAIKRSWRLLCQSTQQQANVLLRFEALSEEHANLAYAHESCKEMKIRHRECKKELGKLKSTYDESADRIKQLEQELREFKEDCHQLRVDREKYVVECGDGEMVRHKIINEYLPTFFRRLHQSAEYKRSLGEVFSLAIVKGFIDGVSIGRKDEDIRAILEATPNLTLLLQTPLWRSMRIFLT